MSKCQHTTHFTIDQSVEILFPLFSPEGEKLWVPGWDYEIVTYSKELHEDFIFLTQHHDHSFTKAIWIVKKYQPDKYTVEFYKIEPEVKVGIIKIRCYEILKSKTKVCVTYEYNGLSAKGNEFIDNFTFEKYQEFITQWHKLLEDYFVNR